MSKENEFGPDLITIIDDDGQEFELEILDEMDYNGEHYIAFLPANMDEEDPASIGCQVVNAKACRPEDRGKKAPAKARRRRKKKQAV